MALLLASRGGFLASASFGIAGLQAAYEARCRTGATDNRRATNAVEPAVSSRSSVGPYRDPLRSSMARCCAVTQTFTWMPVHARRMCRMMGQSLMASGRVPNIKRTCFTLEYSV